jgi:DNA-binding XRE family transcriptional regulator
MIIKNNLKEHRKEVGLTTQAIADYIEVSRVSYENWENGKAYPCLKNIIALCDYLEADFEDLFYQYQEPVSSISRSYNGGSIFEHIYEVFGDLWEVINSDDE